MSKERRPARVILEESGDVLAFGIGRIGWWEHHRTFMLKSLWSFVPNELGVAHGARSTRRHKSPMELAAVVGSMLAEDEGGR